MELTFQAELFPWEANASWVFVALPIEDADKIEDAKPMTGGFGSVKVNVTVGETRWDTSLFPSKELQTYVLPMKKAVRTAESLQVGETATITVELVHL